MSNGKVRKTPRPKKGSRRPLTMDEVDKMELPARLAYYCGVRDQPPVVDFLFIKQIEKIIGHKLEEDEIEPCRFKELIFLPDQFGTWDTYSIPIYSMPSQIQFKIKDLEIATITKRQWKRVKESA